MWPFLKDYFITVAECDRTKNYASAHLSCRACNLVEAHRIAEDVCHEREKKSGTSWAVDDIERI